MFFADATAAVAEMSRVCKPGGTVGAQVYSGLADQPAYGPWIEMVARHAGPDAISALGAYWVHGDVDALRQRFTTAGLEVTGVDAVLGIAAYSSVDEMVRTEVEGTPLIDRLSDEVYRRIREESADVLGQYETTSGAEIPIKAILLVARKPT